LGGRAPSMPKRTPPRPSVHPSRRRRTGRPKERRTSPAPQASLPLEACAPPSGKTHAPSSPTHLSHWGRTGLLQERHTPPAPPRISPTGGVRASFRKDTRHPLPHASLPSEPYAPPSGKTHAPGCPTHLSHRSRTRPLQERCTARAPPTRLFPEPEPVPVPVHPLPDRSERAARAHESPSGRDGARARARAPARARARAREASGSA
jgi:hypothetical protein